MIKLQLIPESSIVDYEIVETILESTTLNIVECAEEAFHRLKFHNIVLQPQELETRVRLIASKKQIPLLPSIFTKQLGPRHGKDVAYKRFWTLVDDYIPDTCNRYYVGLPANQILSIYPRVHLMAACEKSSSMLRWQLQAREKFQLDRLHLLPADIVTFINDDLFAKSWNIYDLDLMCNTTDELITKISSGLLSTMTKGPVVVNITTSIGRCISKEQYRNLMPDTLVTQLKKSGVKIIESISGRYRDRMVGVAYEHLVLTT